jgi:hypothetical protein
LSFAVPEVDELPLRRLQIAPGRPCTVTRGDAIAALPTDAGDRPRHEAILSKVSVTTG